MTRRFSNKRDLPTSIRQHCHDCFIDENSRTNPTTRLSLSGALQAQQERGRQDGLFHTLDAQL